MHTIHVLIFYNIKQACFWTTDKREQWIYLMTFSIGDQKLLLATGCLNKKSKQE